MPPNDTFLVCQHQVARLLARATSVAACQSMCISAETTIRKMEVHLPCLHTRATSKHAKTVSMPPHPRLSLSLPLFFFGWGAAYDYFYNTCVACLQEFLKKYNAYRSVRTLLQNRFRSLQASAVRPAPITPITFEDLPRCRVCKPHGGPCTAPGCEWARLQTMVGRSVAGATVVGVEQILARHLQRRYNRHRDQEVRPRTADGAVNEVHCFHGTAHRDPKELLLDFGDEGLDPRVGNGGFYGKGTYLAEDACYPIGGRYAHRLGPDLVQLMVVKACTGTPCEMHARVDAATRNFQTPPVRIPSRPPVKYGCVKAGPHRPGMAGGGDNESVMYVMYDPQLMLPEYIITVQLDAQKRKARELAALGAELAAGASAAASHDDRAKKHKAH